MGADGGVILLPVKNGTAENYSEVSKLLKPFWQFTNRNGGYYIAEQANYHFIMKHDYGPPNYIIGYYGTDRGNSLNLGDLRKILNSYEDEYDEVFKLTFDELDLDCRTNPYFDFDKYRFSLYRLWNEHFDCKSREESLNDLGDISNIVIENWAFKLKELLDIDSLCFIETWT